MFNNKKSKDSSPQSHPLKIIMHKGRIKLDFEYLLQLCHSKKELVQLPECYLEDITALFNSYYIDSIKINYFHKMVNKIITAFFTGEVDGNQHIQDVKDQLNIILKEIEYAKELNPSKQETIKNDTPINITQINNTSIHYKKFKKRIGKKRKHDVFSQREEKQQLKAKKQKILNDIKKGSPKKLNLI